MPCVVCCVVFWAGCCWSVAIISTLLEETTSARSLSTWDFSLHLRLTPMSHSEFKHCRLLAFCSSAVVSWEFRLIDCYLRCTIKCKTLGAFVINFVYRCILSCQIAKNSLVVLGTGIDTWSILKYNFRLLVFVLVLACQVLVLVLVLGPLVLILVLVLVRKVFVAKRKSFSAVIDTLWHLYSEVSGLPVFMPKFHHLALFGGFAFHKFFGHSAFIKSAINYASNTLCR